MGASEPDPSGAELLEAEAVRAITHGADVQYVHTDDVIDLTWGHPDPSTLTVGEFGDAVADSLAEHGWTALTYGAAAGAMTVREAIAGHVSDVDHPVQPDQVLVTAGSSGGLDLLLTLLTRPGDVVFVEQPTYFLALSIFRDHGLTVVGLADDGYGPEVADFERRAAAVAATGRTMLLYLVSTYSNPTGRCLDRTRASELLGVAARDGVIVVDDDVYRDTAASPPPSLQAIDPAVFRLGSFSKSLAPGLRVGYLTAPATEVARISTCGVLDSGGGCSHTAAMAVATMLTSGRFRTIARAAQARCASRRDALCDALSDSPMSFHRPDGGFFVWLRLPDGVESATVVANAHEHGVLASDGSAFFVTPPAHGYLRLSFSMLDESTLVEGARRLRAVIDDLC